MLPEAGQTQDDANFFELNSGIENFCKKNSADFSRWLQAEAAAFLSYSPLILIAFSILSLVNFFLINEVSAAIYLPTCLLLGFYSYAFGGHRSKKGQFAVAATDVLAFAIVSGAAMLAVLSPVHTRGSQGTPLLTAILVTSAFSFHTSVSANILRNSLTSGCGIALALAFSPIEKTNFLVECAVSVLAGNIINLIIHRMVKIKYYALSINLSELLHAYTEMGTQCYPHQIAQIRKQKSLTDTMPCGEKQAWVIKFDIVKSSQVKHSRFKEAIDIAWEKIIQLVQENYNPDQLTSNGYWVKSMGDGFFLSVGFPFGIPSGLAEETLVQSLSLRIVQIFEREMELLRYPEPIVCALGVARGLVQGAFSPGHIKHYDLHGHGMVLATRYEEVRKLFQQSQTLDSPRHSIIVQNLVYHSLRSQLPGFASRHYREWTIPTTTGHVQDDPGGTSAFILEIPYGQASNILRNFEESCKAVEPVTDISRLRTA